MKIKLLMIVFLIALNYSFAQDTQNHNEILAQNNQAHPEKYPKMQDLRDHKWGVLKENAKLNAEEEKLIRPLFDDYEQKVWKVLQANRDAFRQMKGKDKKAADFEKINEALVNFEIQKANYQKEFYLKLKKVTSAETIFRFMKADRNFTRELMSKPRQKK